MKSLYYICAQPAIIYYAWQLEVMIHNFKKNGIRGEQIHIVLGTVKEYNELFWNNFKEKYPDVLITIYPDNRINPKYIPSLRPHVLKQHFESHPYLQTSAVFYHDCDMLFTGPVDWEKFINDDTWYVSYTASYLGAMYVKSKGLNIFEEMCNIIGIDPLLVEKEEENSGGAQYIMKNVTPEFWDKVERDSEALTDYFNKKVVEYHRIPNYHPIQSWTADMWAILWNGWLFGNKIKTVPEMWFCWPTDDIKRWDTTQIFHNAGVVDNMQGLFQKAMFRLGYPINLNLDDFDKNKCSYNYVLEIKETLK